MKPWIFYDKDSGDGLGGSGGEAGGTGGQSGGGSGSAGASSGDAGAAGAAGAGSGTQDWRAGITDEHLRGAPALKDIPDLDTLVKNHVELQGHLGQSIRIPSEEAGAEDKSAFYQRLIEKVPGVMLKPNPDDAEAMDVLYTQLGRPKEATEYTIPEIDTQGVKLDNAATEAFRTVAHKFGLSARQFKGIVTEVTNANIQAALAQRAKHDEAMKGLHDEWGAAYEERIETAISVAERVNAPPEVVASIRNNQSSPATIKMFYDLHNQIGGEGSGASGDRSGGTATMTPGEAKERIGEIMRDRSGAYWNIHDPGHQAAIERMLELQKLANPGIDDE